MRPWRFSVRSSPFSAPSASSPGLSTAIGDIPMPPDWRERTEWAFARLMYPPGPLNGYRGRDLGVARRESPCGPRIFRAPTATSAQAVRRLTRIHVRSVEQPVNLDEGDAFDWPWLYAVQVGEWGLTDVAGQSAARVPAARRILHGRRFSRRRRVGRVRSAHPASAFPERPDRGHPRRRSHLPHRLRPGESHSSGRLVALARRVEERLGRRKGRALARHRRRDSRITKKIQHPTPAPEQAVFSTLMEHQAMCTRRSAP